MSNNFRSNLSRPPLNKCLVSAHLKDWLGGYCLAVIQESTQTSNCTLPAHLKPGLVKLEFEPDGDYTNQIDYLATHSPASALQQSNLAIADLPEGYRHNILLGGASSGKTFQLKTLLLDQARFNLSQLEQSRRQTDEAATLLLPIHLDLAQVGTLVPDFAVKKSESNNLIQALLQSVLNRATGNAVPNNIFKQVLPLILADNLEQLDPALAPIFFYNFNQWLNQLVPEAYVIFSCRYLDFPLYHPWFKAEQEWQFYDLQNFSWLEVRPMLATKLPGSKLVQLEQTGLNELFQNPAVCNLIYPYLQNVANAADLSELFQFSLNTIFGEVQECVPPLAGFSRLLPVELINNVIPAPTVEVEPNASSQAITRSPDCFAKAVALGLIERHPVAGWVRLANPALDWVLATWLCLQTPPDKLAATVSQVLTKAATIYSNQQILSFLRLLYLVTPVANRSTLFNALLGQFPAEASPTASSIERIFEVGTVDPLFLNGWQAYLQSLLAHPTSQLLGQNLLRLTAAPNYVPLQNNQLGDHQSGERKERLLLAENALEQLLKGGQFDSELYLSLGRVQEQLGKYEAAQQSYRRAMGQLQVFPKVEGAFGIARLLTQAYEYEQAGQQLFELNSRVLAWQAEINNQLSVVKRFQGDFEGALGFARRAVELKGQLPLYRRNLALALYEQGEWQAAEEELANLTTAQPDYADGFYDLGRVQLARGAADLALTNFRRAVELSPTTSLYLYDLGRSLLAQNHYSDAYTHLKAALAQEETQPDYYSTFGLVSLKLGRFDEARDAFLQAIKLTGDKPTVNLLVYLATTEYNRHDYAQANNALSQATELDPHNVLLQLLAGLISEAHHKVEQALAHYLKAFDSPESGVEEMPQPVRTALHLGLARCFRFNQNLEEATRQCQVAMQLQPDAPAVLYESGQLALARNDYAEAAKLFSKGLATLNKSEATAKNPVSASVVDTDLLPLLAAQDKLKFELPYSYAQVLAKLEQPTQALKVLYLQLKNLEGTPKLNDSQVTERRAAVHYQLGLNLLEVQNNQEALRFLSMAVGEEPGNGHYRLGLAQAWLANANPERALQELNQARELEPTLAEVYAEIAQLNLERLPDKVGTAYQNLLSSSLHLYLKALELEPSNITYLYRSALLAYRLQHRNQAIELISRLQPAANAYTASELAEAHLLAACIWESDGDLTKANAAVTLALAKAEATKAACLIVAGRLARKAGSPDKLQPLLDALKQLGGLPLQLEAVVRSEEGWLAHVQHRYSEAAALYAQAAELHQKFIKAGPSLGLSDFYFEGVGLGGEGKNGDSSYLQTVLAAYKMAQAQALAQFAKPEQVLTLLTEVIRLNPALASAYYLRGELLYKQEQYQEALKVLNQAIDLEPTPASFYLLGLVQLKLENFKGAIGAFEQVEGEGAGEEVGQTKSEYFANLGLAYEKIGAEAAARTAYNRGLQVEPENAQLQQALSRCYLISGELLAALQPLQGAVLAEPSNVAYHFELARLYEKLGWWQEAATEYERLTTLDPNDPAGWYKSGQVLLQLGEIKQGRAALEQALHLNPDLIEAHYEIGQSYLSEYQVKLQPLEMLTPDLKEMFSHLSF